MHLYHVLPRERLDEKLAYARAHGGRLLLTSHETTRDSAGGALRRYLHLLPDLVGGISFSSRHEVAALRVTLGPDAEVVHLRGSRDHLDLGAAAQGATAIHVLWEEPGLRFQEWLLVDDRSVVEWTADPGVLARDFHDQLERLRRGGMGPDAFFYPDIDPASQISMARLMGHRLGYAPVDDPGALARAHAVATHRIGAEMGTPTKHLFFVGRPLLELARRLAGPRWHDRRALAFVTGEAPWADIDAAVTEAASELGAQLPMTSGPVGPLELHLADLRAEPARPARFVLGFRVPSHPTPPGLRTSPARALGARGGHRGPLWDLERRVQRLVGPDPGARAITYVFHAFHGARSPDNVVGIAAGPQLPE